jgi:hypothetical protein
MNTERTPAALCWYLTCSLPMHALPTYDQMKAHVETILQHIRPDVEHRLIESRGLYQGAKDWLVKWPELCESTINGGLFFWLDTDGFIGRGVHTEIEDVLKKGLSVYCVLPDGDYYPITRLCGPAFIEGPDWKFYLFIDAKRLAEAHSF